MEEQPKKKRGRPRIHPLPDPNAPKRPGGRPSKTPGVKRVNLGFCVEPHQEVWLAEVKARTGKSYGELIDEIVARYKYVE